MSLNLFRPRLVPLAAVCACLLSTRAMPAAEKEPPAAANRGWRDPLLYLRVHFALKKFTCCCARNPFAARALSPLHALSRRFFYVHRDRFGDLMEVARVHADLAEAIGRGDEDGASACCDAMTDYAVAFTRKIILE